MLIEVQSDIFKSNTQMLIHQANCYHRMASGIAKEIRERYPSAYEVDLQTTHGSLEKLGSYSVSKVTGETLKYIVNLYSQYGYEEGNRKTSYDAMFSGMTKIRDDSRFFGMEFGVPFKIGCGLGGGNWGVVKAILNAVFSDPYSSEQDQPRLCVYKI